MMIFYFYFQETYNNRLRERYRDDTLTHSKFDPNLWMEVGSSGGSDKNRVYGLSNTMADNLRSPVVFQPFGASNQYRAPNLRSSWSCSNTRLNSLTNTTTYQRSTHNSKHLMHNKEQSLSKSKRKSKCLKHNKKRSMKNKTHLMNNKKRLMTSFAKWS